MILYNDFLISHERYPVIQDTNRKKVPGEKIESGEFEFFVGIGKLLKSVGHLQKK